MEKYLLRMDRTPQNRLRIPERDGFLWSDCSLHSRLADLWNQQKRCHQGGAGYPVNDSLLFQPAPAQHSFPGGYF
ncbi:hypothetical protein [Pseudomonas fluorescens]|uniref:hypothetical protein n=1 Tax=Pseudomonas fluorescens TaxID=294 RepID=UPI00177ADE86|nr:hypothetical protein [Pseudomonas fluorescens]